MRVEIIAIGSELTSGQTQDTNSSMLARMLREAGLEVERVTLISDEQQQMIFAFNEVFARADVTIVTGGLGPTEDDRTRFVAAKVFGSELVEHAESLERLQQLFAAFGRPMPKSNVWQAMFPAIAQIIENPMGTARGFALEQDGRIALFAPGVPRELQVMAEQYLLPMILERTGQRVAIAGLTLHTFGLPESELADRLETYVTDFPLVELAYSARFPTIDLRLSAKGDTPQAAKEQIDAACGYILPRLGDHIFGQEDQTLPGVTGALLEKRKLTLALAESCTGGMIAAAITDVPGSSAYFLESAVTYSNQAKVARLGVSEKTLAQHGAVSEQVAREMALGICKSAGADLGLSVTGIAGPDGGTPDKPVGTVHMALVHPDGVLTWVNRFPGSRQRVRTLTCYAALNRIRRYCLRSDSQSPEQFNCTE